MSETQREEDISRAKRIGAGERGLLPDEFLSLGKRLYDYGEFSWARDVLRVSPQPHSVEIDLLSARALLLDSTLQERARCQGALDLLSSWINKETRLDQEVYLTAGSAYIGLWRSNQSLTSAVQEALNLFRRGHQCGILKDFGSTAIKEAFALDSLSELNHSYSSDARNIRGKVVAALTPLAGPSSDNFVLLSNLAQAHLGLAQFDAACQYLRKLMLTGCPEIYFMQLVRDVADLMHQLRHSRDEWQAISSILNMNTDTLRFLPLGTVGLALSGGGFRAALFHIGVLARLAELDLLRHIEVISCVSGGAIVGTYYYLELKHLLETKTDIAITQEDYIAIVHRLEQKFLGSERESDGARILSSFL